MMLGIAASSSIAMPTGPFRKFGAISVMKIAMPMARGMARVSESEFEAVCQRELAEIERRRRLYLGARTRPEVRGRVAIVVDDGVATGATTRAALRAVRARHPAATNRRKGATNRRGHAPTAPRRGARRELARPALRI